MSQQKLSILKQRKNNFEKIQQLLRDQWDDIEAFK